MTIFWDLIVLVACLAHYVKLLVKIFYQQFINEFNADDKRPFIFKMWLPNIDLYRTPTYEIFQFLQIICLIPVFATSISMFIYPSKFN